MEWTKELETGISEIDFQHKRFFELMNAILSLAVDGSEEEKINKSIAMLKIYVRYHFSLEEDLMINSNYPLYKEHISAHRHFKDELRNMEAFLKNQKEPAKIIITRYNYMLVEWFLKHIKVMDKKMSKHLLDYKEKNKSFLTKMMEILSKPFG